MNNQSYSASSIKVLKGLEAVKKRPGMYIGDTEDGSGLHHMIYEVTDNALDEALAGHCNKIMVTLNSDGSVTVIDNGRGIPTDMHKDEKISAAELIMTQLHAGGKFDNDSYKVSGGLHGVGISVVNALSEWLELTVWRENTEFYMRFENGQKIKDLESKISKEPKKTGTQIRFLPSKQIFASTEFDYLTLENRYRELAFLNPEISIELYDKRFEVEKIASLHFEGGILNFVKYLDRSKHVLNKTVRITGEQNNIVVDIALEWNDGYYENVLAFTNNIRQKDGGAHLTGFRGALTRVINNYVDNNQLHKKQKIKLSPEDTREGLTSVVSVRVPGPKFSSQTKDKLISSEVRTVVESIFYEEFSKWLEMNPKDAKLIIGRMIESSIAREAARKARDLSRKQITTQVSMLPGKLANCQEKNPEKSEIFIVEGDSAGGSAKQGRDRKVQAILPLKGKILNVERARFDKMLNSQEIATLITALGITLEGKLFDISRLRYHKIIIMTDADVDGAHIRTLLLTFFFRYLPQLIENGYLYIAQPPLYKVRRGQSDTYLKNEVALIDYLKDIIIKNCSISILGHQISEDRFKNFLEDLVKFSNIIGSYDDKIPDVFLEELLFLDFFDDKYSDQPFNIKKLIPRLNVLFKDREITWSVINNENFIEIEKLEKGVKENFKVNKYLFSEKSKNTLLSIKESLKEFKKNHEITYKNELINETLTIKDLVKTIFDCAKKGLYIQRFKGLGEMNPDQLWDTTLNPENRTLLQVKTNDNSEAEIIFSTLMGEIVEPRREFIKNNALKVSNLDY